MSSRGFFAFSLVLPAVGAILGHLIPGLDFLAYFFWGGFIPYFPIAIVLAILVLKATSFRMLVVLSAAAPVAFGVALAAFVEIIGYAPAMHQSARQFGQQLLTSAATGCGVACCYVGAAWILWALCRKLGWVVNEFGT